MATSHIGPFEVTEKEIRLLSSSQLVGLLERLLNAECWAEAIPQRSTQGTFDITVNDGGEDYRVHWEGPPDQTAYIPRRFTIFQSKAEILTPSKLKTVPLVGAGKAQSLNPAVQEVVDRKGGYVVFSNKTNVTTPNKPTKGRGKATTKKTRTKQSSLVDELRRVIETRAKRIDISVDIYGPPRIRDWVNRFPSVALWIKKQLGMVVADFAFGSADDWQSYRDLNATAFIPYDLAASHIKTIRDTLAQPQTVVRLIGHSGLGKSRLAYEALRKDASHPLTALVVYARQYGDAVLSQVRTLVGTGCRGIIVVDECPPSSHRLLSEEIRRSNSKLSLLTLDHSFVRPDPEDQVITLDHAPKEVIKGIIREFVSASI